MTHALTAVPDQRTDQPSLRPCGAVRCRVCRALGFLRTRHHPLDTPAALATASRIHQAMLAYQAAHRAPCANLEAVAALSGLKSSGLVSLYMRRLADQGLARWVETGGPGRRFRWEAVEACDTVELRGGGEL